jgi:SAM-dependent methyltransferase
MKLCSHPNLIAYDWVSILDSYKKMVKKTDIVLEIGASNLNNTKQLAKYCKQLIGVELIPERTPKNFENVKYKVGDWQKLSEFIKADSIDIAVSTHVIEHVSDDLQAINELYTVLKSGGIALLNTPNRKRLTRTIIEFFTGKRKFPYKEHQREYTEKDLVKLIKKSKFQKYKIIPVVFGLHAGPVYIYKEEVPKLSRQLANFWEIHLYK